MPRPATEEEVGLPTADLAPQLQAMLDAAAGLRAGAGNDPPPVEVVRQTFSAMGAMVDTPPEDVASVESLAIPGPAGDIPARVYRGVDAGPEPGLLVWYHGGGWVIGDLETADGVCRRLANRTGAVVLSVDYRLAPEHPAPAAVEDAWAALVWAAEHAGELGADGTRLAVGGDSAGGNLAALVAQRARDAAEPALVHQLLVYPATDLTRSAASHRDQSLDLFDPSAVGDWFALYLGDVDPNDPSVSPAAAADLSGLPPACVVTAGHDPLRDEGAAYARRLQDAGVAVEHLHYPEMLHGFIQLGALTPVAAAATDAFCACVRTALEED